MGWPRELLGWNPASSKTRLVANALDKIARLASLIVLLQYVLFIIPSGALSLFKCGCGRGAPTIMKRLSFVGTAPISQKGPSLCGKYYFMKPRMKQSTDTERRNSNGDIALEENSMRETTDLDTTITTKRQMSKFFSPSAGVKSIGVDYGTVRTGLAVTVGFNPRPLEIISDYDGNSTLLAQRISQICQRETGVEQIVMGLPLDKNGTETSQACKTREFAQTLLEQLLQKFGPERAMALYLWDERYTSKLALAHVKNGAQSFRDSDVSRTLVDADSACIILEDFYKVHGAGAERVSLRNESTMEYCLKVFNERQEEAQVRDEAYHLDRLERLNARRLAIQKVKEMEKNAPVQKSLSNTPSKKKKQKLKKRKRAGVNSKISSGTNSESTSRTWLTL